MPGQLPPLCNRKCSCKRTLAAGAEHRVAVGATVGSKLRQREYIVDPGRWLVWNIWGIGMVAVLDGKVSCRFQILVFASCQVLKERPDTAIASLFASN